MFSCTSSHLYNCNSFISSISVHNLSHYRYVQQYIMLVTYKYICTFKVITEKKILNFIFLSVLVIGLSSCSVIFSVYRVFVWTTKPIARESHIHIKIRIPYLSLLLHIYTQNDSIVCILYVLLIYPIERHLNYYHMDCMYR